MPEQKRAVFAYKLDIYYQAIAIYAATLAAYAVVTGFAKHSMDFVMRDQVVYLLALCTLAAAAGLLVNIISRREIIIEPDAIVFANRFGRRVIAAADIVWIRIGREKRLKVRGSYKVAKIKLRGKRRLLRMRTSLYRPEDDLIEALHAINHRVQAHARSAKRQS